MIPFTHKAHKMDQVENENKDLDLHSEHITVWQLITQLQGWGQLGTVEASLEFC